VILTNVLHSANQLIKLVFTFKRSLCHSLEDQRMFLSQFGMSPNLQREPDDYQSLYLKDKEDLFVRLIFLSTTEDS